MLNQIYRIDKDIKEEEIVYKNATQMNIVIEKQADVIVKPEKPSETVDQAKLINYDRIGMMKEVNDIIDELQSVLKTKVTKIQLHEKQASSISIPKISLRDCVKDLCKTDFHNDFESDSISVQSYKENLSDSDLISISEYQEEFEPEKQCIDPEIFTPSKINNYAMLEIQNILPNHNSQTSLNMIKQ
jgi:hypothetical protein